MYLVMLRRRQNRSTEVALPTMPAVKSAPPLRTKHARLKARSKPAPSVTGWDQWPNLCPGSSTRYQRSGLELIRGVCVGVFVACFAGTNSNLLYNLGNILPPKPITGQLAKEIQLKHRTSVIMVAIYDQHGVQLDFQPTLGPGPHKVYIVFEERFKVFSFPQLKPSNMYNQTGNEGAIVRRIAFATFSCTVPARALQHSRVQRSQRSLASVFGRCHWHWLFISN